MEPSSDRKQTADTAECKAYYQQVLLIALNFLVVIA